MSDTDPGTSTFLRGVRWQLVMDAAESLGTKAWLVRYENGDGDRARFVAALAQLNSAARSALALDNPPAVKPSSYGPWDLRPVERDEVS